MTARYLLWYIYSGNFENVVLVSVCLAFYDIVMPYKFSFVQITEICFKYALFERQYIFIIYAMSVFYYGT